MMRDNDPVRVFFTDTWGRLAPVLKTIAKELPGIQGLRYITFIAATDVIYELERLGAPFGLDISSDGLRTLARMLIAGKQQARAATAVTQVKCRNKHMIATIAILNVVKKRHPAKNIRHLPWC